MPRQIRSCINGVKVASSAQEKMSATAAKPTPAAESAALEEDAPIRPLARLPYRSSIPVRKIDEAVRRVVQKRLAEARQSRSDARV